MSRNHFMLALIVLEGGGFACGSGAAKASPERGVAATSPSAMPSAPPAALPAAEPKVANPSEINQGDAKAGGACAFSAPDLFANLSNKWEGGCKNGKAHGRGVLRGYEGKRAVKFFFGTMNNGRPKLGVVESEGGYSYGEFLEGKLVDPPDPAENNGVDPRVGAFNEAIAAAKQVSESFKSAGNAASAEFYAGKAKTLEMQVE